MNHLGKENSFSFQRTIHALNEGLKLIIRGGDIKLINLVRKEVQAIHKEIILYKRVHTE